MKKAFSKGMVIFVTASRRENAASPPLPSQPKRAQIPATSREPRKLPAYTTAQLRSMPPTVAFLSSTLMIMSVLPVNSSAPDSTTVPSPKANSTPAVMRTRLGFSSP